MTNEHKIYHSVDELQADLDQWVQHYNHERTHLGNYCFGRTRTRRFRRPKAWPTRRCWIPCLPRRCMTLLMCWCLIPHPCRPQFEIDGVSDEVLSNTETHDERKSYNEYKPQRSKIMGVTL